MLMLKMGSAKITRIIRYYSHLGFVFIRNDFISHAEYKKFSIREIV
jgi:hypothetical protein